jgi:hypothetical protein
MTWSNTPPKDKVVFSIIILKREVTGELDVDVIDP